MARNDPSDAGRALREQAVLALGELLDGFQGALPEDGSMAIDAPTAQREIHRGLATIILRLVFLLFAEARDLVAADSESSAIYARDRSLSALFDELSSDHARLGEADLRARFGAYSRLTALFRAIHGGSNSGDQPRLPPRGGALFDPDAYPFLEGRSSLGEPRSASIPPRVSDAVVLRALAHLVLWKGNRIDYKELDIEHLGGVYERLMSLLVVEARRRAGSYYTPPQLSAEMCGRALDPLLRNGERSASPEQILALSICDPAMGGGAFLLGACRTLASHLEAASGREGALLLIAQRCLYGVDRDPVAVELAKLSLWLLTRASGLPFTFLDHRLICGDSLLGARLEEAGGRAGEAKANGCEERLLHAMLALDLWPESGPSMPPKDHLDAYFTAAAAGSSDERIQTALRVAEERRFLHFEIAFPDLFNRPNPGFDAIVGNPPWVAYVGRAAQPLETKLFRLYLRRSPAFRGYRTLHGLFVHRAASLLRRGGRLGLVVPTSVADLAGYGPTRRAHDALSVVDDALPDFGSDAFHEVFQPAMGLLSTRRAEDISIPPTEAAPWPLARSDLDATAVGLLARLCALPRLPASLFGERGFQTSTSDARKLRRLTSEEAPPSLRPIREGADIGEFVARAPRYGLELSAIQGRFRPDDEWRAVRVLIRQTARFPIAARSDGLPFRNSILAGFAAEGFSEHALVCYLNSSPIRWFHFMKNRDARQGMPQVKIAHLRALPAPRPAQAHFIGRLAELGERVNAANRGITAEDRALLDDIAALALEMTAEERAVVAAWAAANPLPKPAR